MPSGGGQCGCHEWLDSDDSYAYGWSPSASEDEGASADGGPSHAAPPPNDSREQSGLEADGTQQRSPLPHPVGDSATPQSSSPGPWVGGRYHESSPYPPSPGTGAGGDGGIRVPAVRVLRHDAGVSRGPS